MRRNAMLFINPQYDPTFMPDLPSMEPLHFHRRLPGYRPTPLHSLDECAASLGIRRLYVKDESDRLGLPAFKILGASWATFRALCDRYPMLNRNWETLDEFARALRSLGAPVLFSATDGNHGRAVARVATWLGLQSIIYVPEGTAPARIAAIESEAARVEVVAGTYNRAVDRAADDASKVGGLLIQDNGWEGYETIPRYIVEGYSTMLREIDEALMQASNPLPTHVFVQIGVGSFADAVVRYFARKNPRAVIVGVEPESAACALESVRAGRIVQVPGPHSSIMAGMNCDSPSTISFPILQKGVHSFVALPDHRSVEAMRLLAGWGLVSGETGAAGLGALLEIASSRESRALLGLDSSSTVLVFSTEGATNPDLYSKLVPQRRFRINNN